MCLNRLLLYISDFFCLYYREIVMHKFSDGLGSWDIYSRRGKLFVGKREFRWMR